MFIVVLHNQWMVYLVGILSDLKDFESLNSSDIDVNLNMYRGHSCPREDLPAEPSSVVPVPSDHRDGRDVDGVQTLQSLPGNAQEPQTEVS